jgi:hypothetical protein
MFENSCPAIAEQLFVCCRFRPFVTVLFIQHSVSEEAALLHPCIHFAACMLSADMLRPGVREHEVADSACPCRQCVSLR